jgi:hypothetical protein
MTALAALVLAIAGFLFAVAAWTVALTRLRTMTGPALTLVMSLAGIAVCVVAIIAASAGLGH